MHDDRNCRRLSGRFQLRLNTEITEKTLSTQRTREPGTLKARERLDIVQERKQYSSSAAEVHVRAQGDRMQHVRLGSTGLKVSRLCLGTMTFGYQCDEATSIAILDRAAKGGITFLDSSDVYPLGGGLERVGRTEEILGRWLHGRRHNFVVATKCFGATGPQPFHSGNNRRHIFDAVDASLRRLGTDYIDLYQLHGYDPNVTLDETL